MTYVNVVKYCVVVRNKQVTQESVLEITGEITTGYQELFWGPVSVVQVNKII